MPLDPRVQISGDPEEVWLLEWYRVNLRGERILKTDWHPAEEEPYLLTLEMNIHKVNKWSFRHRPRLRIRNVVTGEIVPGVLFND